MFQRFLVFLPNFILCFSTSIRFLIGGFILNFIRPQSATIRGTTRMFKSREFSKLSQIQNFLKIVSVVLCKRFGYGLIRVYDCNCLRKRYHHENQQWKLHHGQFFFLKVKKSYQKTSEIIKRKRVKNIWLNGIVIFTNMTGKKKKRQK